ncbi:MAG TPA: hypothetical protein VD997_04270 [Phycisphaerales bacterium]|nr:hypothetical protein [Phycisphaerales bacterium]
MARTTLTGRMVLGVLLAAGTLAGVEALAQQPARVVLNVSDGPFGGNGLVSKRSVERYAELLSFSPEQKESALTIHEGYQASMKEVQKARSSATEDLNRSAQDSGDFSVFAEKMPAITKEYREKEQKLERTLMEDLKSLCSGAGQEDKWPKVERMRRREVELRRGSVAGEALDLIEIVHNMKLEPSVLAPISGALDEYEIEVDAAVKERQSQRSGAPEFKPGEPPDIEALRAQMDKMREAGQKIKGVNDRFAKRIEAALPEEKQAAFRQAVRQASFPQVYRRSPIVRDLDKALALKDLSNEQREKLTALKKSYERDTRPVNDAWAAAIEASDKEKGEGAGMLTAPGGGPMMIRMGEEPEAIKEARKARRELDDKARKAMKETLNESQQAAIKPQPGEVEEGMEMVTDSVMIRATR